MIVLRDAPFNPADRNGYSAFYEQHVGINWHCLDPNYPRLGFLRAFPLGERVLDIGCGEGAYAYDAACRGSQVVAIDIAGNAIAAFAQRLAVEPYEIASRITLKRQCVEDLLAFDEFSAIIAFEIIEHVPDVPHMLKTMHRALVRSGLLLVTTPNMSTYDNSPDHLRRWTAESLEAAVAEVFGPVNVTVTVDELFIYLSAVK